MSVKSLDREGRWRDTTVGFRVSEEENERINQLAALSGMTKQAFIINRLEGNEITVLATVRVQKALAIQAKRVADELSRISAGERVNERLLDVSETILDVLAQMNERGMAIDKHSDGLTLEEMETSDLSETMAPDMRQIPLAPEEVEPVADADARKPKRHRKSTKGMFKKERP